MDFDDAKENIQPLAAGRNASILQASLRVESPQELISQRQQLEQEIHDYSGDDPLEPWYTYVSWIEQSYPSGGKESGLEEVLTKCLSRFEKEERYYQDRRMVKLYIKFIDSHKNPTECYQQLFNGGIGTMVADFYIAWAYYYDLVGNNRKADEIFRRGIACRAEPLEELKEAYQHFGFSVGQRMMYQDDESAKEDAKRQLQERRLALTSLRAHRRKAAVGSIRTGAAVKSYTPGIVQSDSASTSRGCNARVRVLNDENDNPNRPSVPNVVAADAVVEPEPVVATESSKSVVRSIIDAARDQENLKEPGPWNKAHDKKKSGKLFSTKKTNELSFDILEDDAAGNDGCDKPLNLPIAEAERNYEKPFKYPTNFQSKNKALPEWNTPVTIELEPDARTLPQYNKCMLYPRPNMEFQSEELRIYKWLKRRGIENTLTKRCDPVWSTHDVTANVRQYPNFAKSSRPQRTDELDKFYMPDKAGHLMCAFDKLYDAAAQEEFQWEELALQRFKRNETIMKMTDMEETVCLPSERMQRRKSFFPARKSLAAKARQSIAPQEQSKKETHEDEAALVDDYKKDIAPVLSPTSDAPQELLTAEAEVQTVLPAPVGETEKASISKSILQTLTALNESEAAVPSSSSPLPFQIFVDESVREAETASNPNAKAVVVYQDENSMADFKFKTPALPPTATSAPKPARVFSDIYVDPSDSPESTAGAVGIFDAEETCSTQIFNIFLKSQPMSTPKAPQKTVARQFGTVLKEVSAPTTSAAATLHFEEELTAAPQAAATGALEAAGVEVASAAAVNYSPLQQKQLSTILEISEHGTTQGTHTTGASTKSTISSPEFESEQNAATGMPMIMRLTLPQSDLEPLQEGSRETSSSSTNVAELMDNMKLTADVEMCDLSKKQLSQKLPATPANARQQKQAFSILEDHTDILLPSVEPKQVGNFTRLEEREDTASAGFAMRSIRYQEDKTDTISKVLLASRQNIKFQDDRTETIPKMLLAPVGLSSAQFETDKTETIPKISFKAPALPAAHDSLNMDNSIDACFMLSPPKLEVAQEPAHFETDKTDTRPKIPFTADISANLDDSVDACFVMSPPKLKGAAYAPSAAKRTAASFLDSFSNERSPHASFSKQFCDIKTPDLLGKSAQQQNRSKLKGVPLFEDELPKVSKPNVLDSFRAFSDLSLCGTQPENKEKTKSSIRDSFIADFSYIPETQHESFVKETQHISFNKAKERSVIDKAEPEKKGNTLPADDSVILDSQPPETASKWYQNKSSSQLQSELPKGDFSILMNSQTLETSSKWRPNKSISRTTEHTPAHFLNDFPAPKDQINISSFAPLKSSINSSVSFPNDSLKVDKKIGDIMPSPSPLNYNSKIFSNSFTKQESKSTVSSSLKFLSDSRQQQNNSQIGFKMPQDIAKANSSANNSKIRFLDESAKSIVVKTSSPPTTASLLRANTVPACADVSAKSSEQSFELNAATEMFASGSSMIRNSTWLPNHDQLKKKSLHIKTEPLDFLRTSDCSLKTPLSANTSQDSSKISKITVLNLTKAAEEKNAQTVAAQNQSTTRTEDSIVIISTEDATEKCTEKSSSLPQQSAVELNNDDDFGEMSIYFKHTPKTPELRKKNWDDSPECAALITPNNSYVHAEVDLNYTNQLIDNICVDPDVNPFNSELINAFLDHIDFSKYISNLPSCQLVNRIVRLHANAAIKVYNDEFEVVKLIGEGAYGSVFSGLHRKSGKMYALKQERPPSHWEYYICLEIQSRIKIDDLLAAYMSVDYALIGNNASVLISPFSPYGSLITVCNKIKKCTMKNVDEYVVMLLSCELLEIIDHLHAIGIIHADVKADNLLLMKKLSHPKTEQSLHLIDFGCSIDMKLFGEGQTFSYSCNDNSFKCVEMREKRPWTYQLDLYGIAGVIHVLLFGKYMEIEKRPNGSWMHKTHLPRYFNKMLWERIFFTLLNIRDCSSMPDLQQLRTLLKEELADKEKYVLRKVNEFNLALSK